MGYKKRRWSGEELGSQSAQRVPYDPGRRACDTPEHPYYERSAVLATKHDKLSLIAPALKSAVGLQVEVAIVDTDSLGTFTCEIPRVARPLETAVAKARLGMEATGSRLGVASEGSIGPDPVMPIAVTDREIVVLVDDERRIVVWEEYMSWDIVVATTTCRPGESLESFAASARFPEHRLIVRPNCGSVRPIYKGIDDFEALNAAVHECSSASSDRSARVETDLRAHACPSRRAIIASAAERLAFRLASRCPACGTPGWGRVDVVFGVPCSWCGNEVRLPRSEVDGCPACEHRESRPLVPEDACVDPGECEICNP